MKISILFRAVFCAILTCGCLPGVSCRGAETNGEGALHALETALEKKESGDALAKEDFAQTPLTKEQSAKAREILWKHHLEEIAAERTAELKAGLIQWENHEMPFFMTTFGKQPKEGWSLWISMHGGGSGPKQMNDGQWENQKHLYRLEEGIYVAPRAPTNTWNMWHEPHIDPMFERLIQDLIALKQVDPDRVYIMGYSAGGDGVYQLGPRMADHWTACGMMAGHPNDASWLGLRNVGFAIQVGGNDGAYDRNKVAQKWIEKLDQLQKEDPKGYVHFGKIHENKGHWMDGEDAKVLPWMAALKRNPIPERIVWKESDATHRYYWLAVPDKAAQPGTVIVAEHSGQIFEIKSAGKSSRLLIRLDDRMADLEEPVSIMFHGQILFQGKASRTIATLIRTLEKRGDPKLTFDSEIAVEVPVEK